MIFIMWGTGALLEKGRQANKKNNNGVREWKIGSSPLRIGKLFVAKHVFFESQSYPKINNHAYKTWFKFGL